VPPDSVRCTRELNSKLATFGNSRRPLRIIHRTVRCSTVLSGVPSGATVANATVECNGRLTTLQCADCARRVADGAPNSEQYLSGVPPDCPVAPHVRAPTVGTQRLGDVAGAPDCPMRHTTKALTNGHFGGWGYNYPQPPHFNASKF
jgi:hypothetical protein